MMSEFAASRLNVEKLGSTWVAFVPECWLWLWCIFGVAFCAVCFLFCFIFSFMMISPDVLLSLPLLNLFARTHQSTSKIRSPPLRPQNRGFLLKEVRKAHFSFVSFALRKPCFLFPPKKVHLAKCRSLGKEGRMGYAGRQGKGGGNGMLGGRAG